MLKRRYRDDNKQAIRERKKAETKKGNVRQEGRKDYDKERYSCRVLPFYRTVKQSINSDKKQTKNKETRGKATTKTTKGKRNKVERS